MYELVVIDSLYSDLGTSFNLIVFCRDGVNHEVNQLINQCLIKPHHVVVSIVFYGQKTGGGVTPTPQTVTFLQTVSQHTTLALSVQTLTFLLLFIVLLLYIWIHISICLAPKHIRRIHTRTITQNKDSSL